MISYGLSASCLREMSLQETVETISAQGFAVIEVSADEPKWWSHPDQRRELLSSKGISIRSVHAGQISWDLSAPDPDEREKAQEGLLRSCRQAVELGVDLVICHVNGPKSNYTQADYESNMELAAQSLTMAAASAGEIGVRLAVETMVARGQRRPGNHVSEILEMIKPLGEHIGICVDTGHTNSGGSDVAAEILAAGDRLFATHLQDNLGQADEDPHLFPGRGSIDWDSVLDALGKLDFTGPRTIEINLANSELPQAEAMARLGEIRRQWQQRR